MNKFLFIVLCCAISITNCKPIENEDNPEKSPSDSDHISKRSLKADTSSFLTGFERISKRSADEPELEREKRQAVFLPKFHQSITRERRSADDDDLDGAPSSIVFLRKSFNRQKRHVYLPSFHRGKRDVVFLPRSFNRGKRSTDDMDAAETVFLPSFRRQGFRRF